MLNLCEKDMPGTTFRGNPAKVVKRGNSGTITASIKCKLKIMIELTIALFLIAYIWIAYELKHPYFAKDDE